MTLRIGSVRLALCAMLIGTASAWALTPHDKAVGPRLQQANEKQSTASRDYEGSRNDQRGTPTIPPVVQLLPTPKTQAETEDDARERDAKYFNDKATIVIAGVTLLVLIGQTVVFGLQAHRLKQTIDAMDIARVDQNKSNDDARQLANRNAAAAERAADAAKDAITVAHRPWITVDVEFASGLRFSDRGAELDVIYTLKNIGNSPAQCVLINDELYTPALGIDMMSSGQKQKALIVQANANGGAPFGFTIFPNDEVRQPTKHLIPAEQLTKIATRTEFIRPSIVGVVQYQSSLFDAPRLTGFLYDVIRSDRFRPESALRNRARTAIFPDERDVPLEDLRLRSSFIEGGYAT